MKKPIVAVLLSLCCLLLTPALASAAPSAAPSVTPVSGAALVLAALVNPQAELTASTPADYDCFGRSIAVSGNTALVGAFNHTVAGQEQAGVAYVFTRTGTTWSQQAKLSASNPALQDWFGYSVALSGDSAAVGAWRKTVRGKARAGACYLFSRLGTTWSARAEVRAPKAAAADDFGCSVALSDTTLFSGADQRTVSGHAGAGAAYVYRLSPTITKLNPTSGKRGAVVTISGAFFGARRGASCVEFGSTKCRRYVSWSDDRIICRVPAKATLGKTKVTVRTAAGASNKRVFSVKR
jgi:hypothetical protein